MAKHLVIVESPAKAKTIKKFLGTNYEVIASNGHVRDLPKSQLGIDVENDYEPKYITIRGKGDILAKLRNSVKKSDKVYLATDPDREGEAISWHLAKALKLPENSINRITFNEITKNAIKNSIKEARELDLNLVDSQQTRRILDRMVGYKISPLLWSKIKSGLSAGRVQSVALRIICDREEEINAFVPKEYWNINATFKKKGVSKLINAKFVGTTDKKITISSEEEKEQIVKAIEKAKFVVSDIKTTEKIKKAPLPFTTSALQIEAAKTLNFSTQKTMRIAQALYEGVDVKGHGTIGLISYLRTDSTRISEEADSAARTFIDEKYGSEYVASKESNTKNNKKIQDAHEAIRPTYVDIVPNDVKDDLSRDQYRLYQLIWKRFVASRMQAAKYETKTVKIDGAGYRFSAASTKCIFDGFMSVYKLSDEDEEEKETSINNLESDDKLTIEKVDGEQHFTQPSPHYTEATLVKTLEELGIGRPSTYAPTITTILARRYVIKENKNIYVTDLGEAVNSIMKQAFPSIVDVNFTATMEDLLDSIETGQVAWKTIVRNFYPDLDKAICDAQEVLEKIQIADQVTEELCEECGKNLVIKYGPHGKFLACPGFPDCRFTKPFLEKIATPCPKCGKDVIIRKTKKGRRYYSCIDSQNCDFISWQKPSNEVNQLVQTKEND